MTSDVEVTREGALDLAIVWHCWSADRGRAVTHRGTDHFATPQARDFAYDLAVKSPPGCPHNCEPASLHAEP